jgi:hypothetical protein
VTVLTRRVAIWEVGYCDNWRVEGQGGYRLDATLPTAADALRLVKLEDERAALLGQQVVTTVTWNIRTGIGRRVVQALTGR